ncbi:hypothetical protein BATDEDRAFT_25134 [Batrachochytrium dendrobatidis JAM81]|uniref:Late endosomal/lysosomal adaptor and MAPK and MTOR activator 5 n=2 Tax=Batrachochytrium dendrobatidis TaxID=109871 RepID=F4P2Q2_BATDJ|nr:uncharacterized protein BATDEDRAFT_25134 [Batrachochytrium dendrobatidis JAM81]EGF80501.1 hypothetical protein BATDEDRAFT_25134 [Batrachochytrium dendrobatidis JAM81]OAJ40946.1 hypothetical protein BDEG_24620 [Batrachochytrium dendrobatidis JEL423]|eukprot:XP_006679031.1 hypothetical protein BATDEDRAFT_25134 [Batrachochytrium dendrobatidis JAM81]
MLELQAEEELRSLKESIPAQVGVIALNRKNGSLLLASGEFESNPSESALQIYGLFTDSLRILAKADKAETNGLSDSLPADVLHRIVVSSPTHSIVISGNTHIVTAVKSPL